MSKNLQIGAQVEVDAGGRKAIHTIIARKSAAITPSGVAYRLLPAVEPEWIDSHLVRKSSGFGSAADPFIDPFAGDAA